MIFQKGIVEDNKDPLKHGRVRVRIPVLYGDKSAYPTETLPWAEVIGSNAFGLISGVGVSSVLRQGTWVYVLFNDDDQNKPVVIGTVIGTNTESSENVGDPDGVYPLKDRLNKSDINPSMDSKYTTMQMIETPCGHKIELDDTPGDSRIKITHFSGTSILIDNDGNINIDCKKNAVWNIEGDNTFTVKGATTIKASSITLDTPTTSLTGNADISGVSSAGDHVSSGISGKSHTHGYHHGTTTPPQ